ncbi:uncharacterized protein [Antedon mediterranea]|uniref:uncharacterized protein n=1 Tax=Antedon mediterranea TaxID=105859 RepID=UPI003AF47B86
MVNPVILPNSVSSKDWSVAEENLDIVLIQFYRCKLCNNKFSSLSRSVVIAHMIGVHESEWKAACVKVKDSKNNKGLVDNTSSKQQEVIKNISREQQEVIENLCKQYSPTKTNLSSPPKSLHTRIILDSDMVPRPTSAKKTWKRSAEPTSENEPQNKKIDITKSYISKSSATDKTTVDSLSVSTGSVGPLFSNTTMPRAILSVQNGVTYVTHINQPTVTLEQPVVTIGQPAVTLGQPAITLGQPAVTLGQSAVVLGQPGITQEQPCLTLEQPVINLKLVSTDGKNLELPQDCSPAKDKEICCKQCGFKCSSWNEHWSHSHEHLPTTEKIRYQCQTCKVSFARYGKLHQHQESTPECRVPQGNGVSLTISCALCNFTTNTRHSLNIHIGMQHKEKPKEIKIVYCTGCNARFNSNKSLRRHHKNGRCGKKRGRPKGVKSKTPYKRKSCPPPTSQPEIVCDLCNKMFRKKSVYRDHYTSHFEERKQKCKECDKAFKTKRSLRQHMVVHKGIKHSCDLCDFDSFWIDSIKKHKELKHFSENLPYHTCSICPYKTKDSQALKAHVKYTHLETKNYICETCGKSFKLASALKCHQETHNKDIPYPCDKCDYVGHTRFSLYSHKKVHITKDEMKYKCNQCSWTGRRSNELARHKQKHSDDKLFCCHHCGLSYKHKHGLTRHLKEKHVGHNFTTVEISEPEESIYTDDIIVAQVFEV